MTKLCEQQNDLMRKSPNAFFRRPSRPLTSSCHALNSGAPDVRPWKYENLNGQGHFHRKRSEPCGIDNVT